MEGPGLLGQLDDGHLLNAADGPLAFGPRCPACYLPPNRLCLERFSVSRCLGRGKAREVLEALDVDTGHTVALKCYRLGASSVTQARAVADEVDIHSRIDHPHAIPLWAAFKDRESVYILLPLAAYGDLCNSFDRIKHDTASVAELVAMPLLSCLAHLHERGIAHRDIKLENVFVGSRGNVMLADFGLAVELTRRRALTQVGTLSVMAPEVLLADHVTGAQGPLRCERHRDDRREYGTAADVWAVGVLVWEMLTGTVPYRASCDREMIETIATGIQDHPSYPRLPSDARSFIEQCLTWDPAKRPTARQLYAHPFVTQRSNYANWRSLAPPRSSIDDRVCPNNQGNAPSNVNAGDAYGLDRATSQPHHARGPSGSSRHSAASRASRASAVGSPRPTLPGAGGVSDVGGASVACQSRARESIPPLAFPHNCPACDPLSPCPHGTSPAGVPARTD